MARTPLNLNTLGQCSGGQAEKIINAAINKAVADFDDRGQDCKARVVTIEVTIGRDKPEREEAIIDVKAAVKVPPYRTGTTMAAIMDKKGQPVLVFQEHNPDNADQETFPSMDGKEDD